MRATSDRIYNQVVYEWNEVKREANLKKHGFDFSDACLIYENEAKVTLTRMRKGEARNQDLAVVQVYGFMLSLAYVIRGENIRVISLRQASRKEKAIYANRKQN